MNQKIPPEVLKRKEHALVGQAKMHFTAACDAPCISFNDVYAIFIHNVSLQCNHGINGEFGRLAKNAHFSVAEPYKGLGLLADGSDRPTHIAMCFFLYSNRSSW